MKESFIITELSRGDLEELGFDSSKVSDATMERLASRLGDAYCDQLFWTSLDNYAEFLGIPKKKTDNQTSNKHDTTKTIQQPASE